MSDNEKNMNRQERDGVVFLTFPSLEKYSFVNHAFSTRTGGVSEEYMLR